MSDSPAAHAARRSVVSTQPAAHASVASPATRTATANSSECDCQTSASEKKPVVRSSA